MKTVITTVGTSLIINYQKSNNNRLTTHKNYLASAYKEKEDKHDKLIKESISKWISDNSYASAEISSLYKIQQNQEDEIKVILITTDTIGSNLCAELLNDFFKNKDNIIINKIYCIPKLNVKSRNDFVKEGVPNLIMQLSVILENEYNPIFNITGGYKGIIPLLTIYSAVNDCEINYIYEEFKELISIPKLPIKIDIDFVEKYYDNLIILKKGLDNYNKTKANEFEIYDNLEKHGFIEIADNMAILSPIGNIFLKKYQSQFNIFYCPDEVWKEIQNQKDIKRILKIKFNTGIWESKTETKQDHLVYDDGNNKNRIYYFKNQENTYIYKIFENEENAQEYINQKVDKKAIIKKSNKRNLQKESKNV